MGCLRRLGVTIREDLYTWRKGSEMRLGVEESSQTRLYHFSDVARRRMMTEGRVNG